jgi:hypothetical protein
MPFIRIKWDLISITKFCWNEIMNSNEFIAIYYHNWLIEKTFSNDMFDFDIIINLFFNIRILDIRLMKVM